jgi:hypothetical protein
MYGSEDEKTEREDRATEGVHVPLHIPRKHRRRDSQSDCDGDVKADT